MGEKERTVKLAHLVGGRYRVLATLGRGAMGDVFKARDTLLGRVVALKRLHAGKLWNPVERQRFKREADVLSTLSSRHAVRVFDFVEEPDGSLFIVMEYVRGDTLEDYLGSHGGRLPVLNALQIAEEIALGVGEAHGVQIVHRDLKPANIMLVVRSDRKIPIVVVLDFGLAKAWGRSDLPNITEAGLALGTPLYMSPEQGRGMEASPRSDVYSLGVMLFLMLSGRLPLRAESTAQQLRLLRDELPPPLREIAPAVPEEICGFVDRCLAKDPYVRPRDATECAALLRAFLQELEGSRVQVSPDSWRSAEFPGETPTWRERAGAMLRRHVGWAGWAVAALIVAQLALATPSPVLERVEVAQPARQAAREGNTENGQPHASVPEAAFGPLASSLGVPTLADAARAQLSAGARLAGATFLQPSWGRLARARQAAANDPPKTSTAQDQPRRQKGKVTAGRRRPAQKAVRRATIDRIVNTRMRRAKKHLRGKLDRLFVRGIQPAGRLTVSFTISSRGGIQDLDIHNTTPLSDASRIVRRYLSRKRLPASVGGPHAYYFKWVFG